VAYLRKKERKKERNVLGRVYNMHSSHTTVHTPQYIVQALLSSTYSPFLII
jgi:hypothetical protein